MDRKSRRDALPDFMQAMGLPETPWGAHYAQTAPAEGLCPKPGRMPTIEEEALGRADFGAMWENFSCVLGLLRAARRKKVPAFFEPTRFGCPGGSFYLGFHKPQLEFVCRYVSTGIPGVTPGERYLPSPEAVRLFFNAIDPRPAPARYCVFRPMETWDGEDDPEVAVFFVRPEALSGLAGLAYFVTGDLEAVAAPFGAGCSNILTWPLHYLSRGRVRAVLGGFDPSARKCLKVDELTLAVPLALYDRMLEGWRDAFPGSETWEGVLRKAKRSREVWGD